jgi:hypothetical protein
VGGIETRAPRKLGYRPPVGQPVPPHLSTEVTCHAPNTTAIRASHDVIVP